MRCASAGPSSLCLLVALVLFAGAPLAADAAVSSTIPPVADPFADPKNDPHNPLRYIANNVLTTIAFVLTASIAFSQTYLIIKWRTRWMMTMTFGIYCFAAGLGCRWGLHSQPDSKNIYLLEYLLVVLSPCTFIAGEYMLLGRFATHLRGDEHLLFRPRRITLIFVTSDIVTFLIQAMGGSSIATSTDINKIHTAIHIMLLGLVLQLLSFVFFIFVYVRFMLRVRARMPATWTADAHRGRLRDWRSLAGVMLLSCICISIRCLYRVIEMAQGFGGTLSTTEWYFYAFDTLPLLVAIAVYVPFWPGRFVGDAAPAPGGGAGAGMGAGAGAGVWKGYANPGAQGSSAVALTAVGRADSEWK